MIDAMWWWDYFYPTTFFSIYTLSTKMSAFDESEEVHVEVELKNGGDAAASSSSGGRAVRAMVNFESPSSVVYHPSSGIPAEFCEFSETFDKDLPWILDNCPDAISPDVLEKVMAKALAQASLGEDGAEEEGTGKKEKMRGAGITVKKAKSSSGECRVIIMRVQRQKRKFITAVSGMETVPDVRLKDVSKLFGKKFASGCAVSNTPSGDTEIVIQGDVQFDLPPLLMSQYKVPATAIFFMDEKHQLTAFA